MSDETTEAANISQAETLKYDYFVSGAVGATIAYIIKDDQSPEKFGLNASTLETFAMVFLAMSFYYGLKRIERVNDLLRHEAYRKVLNDRLVNASKLSPNSDVTAYQSGIRELLGTLNSKSEADQSASGAAYNSRHFWLYLGFCSIFLAKVWQPYEAPALASAIGAPPAESTMLTQSTREAIPSTNLPATATKPEIKLMDLSSSTNNHHN